MILLKKLPLIKLLISYSWAFCLLSICLSAPQVEAKSSLKIALLFDGPWEGNAAVKKTLFQEIKLLTEGQKSFSEKDLKSFTAQWTPDSIEKELKKIYSKHFHILISFGALSSQKLSKQNRHPLPTLAAFSWKGKQNKSPQFSHIEILEALNKEITQFYELKKFKKLGILIGSPYAKHLSKLKESSFSKKLPSASYRFISVDNKNIQESLKRISSVDALYIALTPPLTESHVDLILNHARKNKIPSFSFFGRRHVQKGALAGLALDSDMPRLQKLARHLALQIQEILEGKKPYTLASQYNSSERLILNLETAQKIGWDVPWNILEHSERIYTDEVNLNLEKLSLKDAVKKALLHNLEYKETQFEKDSIEDLMGEKKADLLPKVDLLLNAKLIDKDRARASLGAQAEQNVQGAIRLRQVLFSEKLWTQLSVYKKKAILASYEKGSARLNLIQSSAIAFIQSLKLRKLQTIREQNLKSLRNHLKVARRKKAVGSGKKSDVYRWEIQVAQALTALEESRKKLEYQNSELKEDLGIHLSENLELQELDHRSSPFLSADPNLSKLFKSDADLRKLEDFLYNRALKTNPEIQALNTAHAIQNRLLWSARNSIWAPTLALEAQYSRDLYKGGASKDGAELNLPPALGALDFPQARDDKWHIGLELSWPLFSGGERTAQLRKESKLLKKVKIQKTRSHRILKKNIHTALHALKAQYRSILFSKNAAQAAEKNYKIIQKAYTRGAASITTLLDAQTSALKAQTVLAQSHYDFYISNIQLGRNLGSFSFLNSLKQNQDLSQNIKKALSNKGQYQ